MTVLHPRLQDWRPPEGFREVPGGLDGVVVYAPIPEGEEEPEAPKTFRCPNCGATTGFDEKKGVLHCPYCGHTEEPVASKVGLEADHHEFTLDALAADESGWGVERRELHCESCGTNLSVEAGTLSTSCPFCASNQVNLRDAAQVAMRPRFLVPFSVDSKTVAASAKTWLGKGWMHPAGLSKMASVDHFTGIYLSYWTFSADMHSSWEAEVGYERSESYYDSSSGEWRTRTVIDWEWQSGTVHPSVDNLLIPGSTKLSRRLLDRMDDFDLSALVEYAADYLAGWQAQAYDIPLPDAWELGKNAMRDHAKAACYSDIPTSHVRNFSMSADFDDERWRLVLLPIYISAYRFNSKVYRVMVNGQSGTVAGQKPVAWWKIWTAIAAMWTPSVLLALIGLILLIVGVGVIALVIAFFLLFPAGYFSLSLYRKAVESEAE